MCVCLRLCVCVGAPCSLPQASLAPSSGGVSQEQWLANLLARLTEGYQSTGILVLVSVYTYFMAVCFLPPAPGKDALYPHDPDSDAYGPSPSLWVCVCMRGS